MNLKIKPVNEVVRKMYENHSHFHQGDSGLDLYIVEDQIINPKETVRIKLGISCENLDGVSYFLMPRSSISKTPLRLANAVGLIDAGYRGEIMAAVDNIKDIPYKVEMGQRLFQRTTHHINCIEFGVLHYGKHKNQRVLPHRRAHGLSISTPWSIQEVHSFPNT